MFVGDSLSLNQWESLTCMIHQWVPNSKYSVIRTEGLSSVTFEVGFSYPLIIGLIILFSLSFLSVQ